MSLSSTKANTPNQSIIAGKGSQISHVIQVTGDNNKIWTSGLAKLPTDYSTRIQNFVHYYLGTPHQPAPFGGRAAELAALDAWLNDPSAPPYALLAAEAGRGKSALLVQWVDSLIARGNVTVVFVPVSIRFETNRASVALTTLAARLAEVYGEPIKWQNRSAQEWRGVCESYLRRPTPDGKPVVVILDGLDEAAEFTIGSSFFPSLPPAGIRAIVSARYLAGDANEQGWRRRLGWESEQLAYTLPLPPLTSDGLRDVLHKMGNPLDKLVTNVDIISQLYRLSEGDPLLVRLYVEALLPYSEQVAMITPEQLQTISPGLEGYFERWWDEQEMQWDAQNRDPLGEKDEVLTFFNLCAAALGPLTRQDIANIAGGRLTSGLRLKRIAKEVERFIIGNGKERGYTFSHPRLSYYFWEQMTQSEQKEWETRFIDYGCSTLNALNDGSLHPSNASSYTIEYYAAHLERANGLPEVFYALVSKGWMQAWEALEGTYAGFLNDVERAWKQADGERNIAMQIKCALCFASVTSLSTNIPSGLLKELVKRGEWGPAQGVAYACKISPDERRAEALAKLIPYLPPSEQPSICDEVLQICSQTQDNKIKASALVELCIAIKQKEEVLEQALNCIQSLSDNKDRKKAELIEKLAPHLSLKLLYRARNLTQQIRHADCKSLALGSIATYLPESERDETLLQAMILNSRDRPNFTWPKLAPYLSDSLLRELLSKEFAAIEGGHNPAWYSVIADTVFHLAKRGHLDEAIDMARKIWHGEGVARALAQILPYVDDEAKRQNLLAEAKSAAENVFLPDKAAWTWIEFMPYLTSSEQEQYIIKIREWMTPRWTSDKQRFRMLIELAKSEGVLEKIKSECLQEALDIIEGSYESAQRDEMMAELAPNLSVPLLRKAVRVAKSIRDEIVQTEIFLSFLSLASLPKRVQSVLGNRTHEIALRIGSDHNRASFLIALFPHLSDTEMPSIRSEILQAIKKIEHDSHHHAEFLARFARHLVKQGHYQDALELTETITLPQKRFQTAIVCSVYLPKDTGLSMIRTFLDSAFITLEKDQWAYLVSSVSYILVTHGYSDVAVDAARKIDNNLPKEKADALAKIVNCLPKQEREALVTEALDAAKAIPYQPDQLLATARLASYLSEDEIRLILDWVLTINHSDLNLAKQEVSIALLPYLDEQTRNEVIQKLLQLPCLFPLFFTRNLCNLARFLTGSLLEEARCIAHTRLSNLYQAQALTALATRPTEPESTKIEALKEVIKMICGPNGTGLQLMNGIANTLSTLPRENLLPIWNETIRTLGLNHKRQKLLLDLTELIPVIVALGETNVIEESVEVIQEVCEWWP